MNGTPRSSGEFYSISNNSNETLASDYVSQPSTRLLSRAVHQRQASSLAPPSQRKHPETLMMGYAQIMGSFTLDGSLVNQAPFEEVKRKGVVGGQGGGGVVGVERTKRESGLFGALGWSNIGESLGGLLGSSEPSSIREMRGMASSKTVPLITTPQSILFVDLQLAPGESRSYTYTFTLPRGLPPTHKGRSIKTAYHLTIGTQRNGRVHRLAGLERHMHRIAGYVAVCEVNGGGHCFAEAVRGPPEHDDGDAAPAPRDLEAVRGLVGRARQVTAEDSNVDCFFHALRFFDYGGAAARDGFGRGQKTETGVVARPVEEVVDVICEFVVG
jgi:hypothetical protein